MTRKNVGAGNGILVFLVMSHFDLFAFNDSPKRMVLKMKGTMRVKRRDT